MSRTPTPQQQAVCDYVANLVKAGAKGMLKVEACAGSGKTSTLVVTAEASPVPSIYLAFNKVTATEAAEKFPKHVECRTTHSLAYAAYGAKLNDKLSRPRGKYVNVAGTGSEIARFYGIRNLVIDEDLIIPANFLGLLVKETVALFEQSADLAIKMKHVPTADLFEKCKGNSSAVNVAKKIILANAESLWEDRINLRSEVLATHDTYLKLYQMSKPKLAGKSIVYVDEFQDTTPCVLDIVMQQTEHAIVVMVGDARQAIYGWRGAVNAMQMVNADALYLTKSFRYGQSIADLATAVLERDMVIDGNEKIQSVVAPYNLVDRSAPYTRLFRTNTALLTAAVEEIQKGTEVSLEIDVRDFVKLLQSAVALNRGDMKNVKHDSLLAYSNWGELVEESKHSAELGRIVKVVKEGKADQWIQVLERHQNSKNPHITFTTAHKSKGREFEQVIVENDFKSGYDENGDWVGLPVEEQNLLYVALTRAILKLEYNATTEEYLSQSSAHDHIDHDCAEADPESDGSLPDIQSRMDTFVKGQLAPLIRDVQDALAA